MKNFTRLFDVFRSITAATEKQLTEHVYDGDRKAARTDIFDGVARGFFTAEVHLIRGKQMPGPIAVLSAGGSMPNAEHLAYVAEKRWNASLEPELVIRGTYKLSAYFAARHSAVPSPHLSHEIALSSVYFAKQKTDPSFQWTLVFQGGPRGVRVDAIDGDGTLVELVGRYSGEKLAQKVALTAAGYNLELW
jgi:hypothetical protein